MTIKLFRATGCLDLDTIVHSADISTAHADSSTVMQAVLPSMTCHQLAKTGRTVLETYRAALLNSEAAVDTTAGTGDLLNYFISQLPHQSWLLTYRAAVEQHLEHHQQSQVSTMCSHSLASAQSAASDTACGPQQAPDGNNIRIASGDGIQGCQNEVQHLGKCTPEDLEDILAAVAAMPIQVVQPLPIGEVPLTLSVQATTAHRAFLKGGVSTLFGGLHQ